MAATSSSHERAASGLPHATGACHVRGGTVRGQGQGRGRAGRKRGDGTRGGDGAEGTRGEGPARFRGRGRGLCKHPASSHTSHILRQLLLLVNVCFQNAKEEMYLFMHSSHLPFNGMDPVIFTVKG